MTVRELPRARFDGAALRAGGPIVTPHPAATTAVSLCHGTTDTTAVPPPHGTTGTTAVPPPHGTAGSTAVSPPHGTTGTTEVPPSEPHGGPRAAERPVVRPRLTAHIGSVPTASRVL